MYNKNLLQTFIHCKITQNFLTYFFLASHYRVSRLVTLYLTVSLVSQRKQMVANFLLHCTDFSGISCHAAGNRAGIGLLSFIFKSCFVSCPSVRGLHGSAKTLKLPTLHSVGPKWHETRTQDLQKWVSFVVYHLDLDGCEDRTCSSTSYGYFIAFGGASVFS